MKNRRCSLRKINFGSKRFIKGLKAIWSIVAFFVLFFLFTSIFYSLLKLAFDVSLNYITAYQSEILETFHPFLATLLSVIVSTTIIKYTLYRSTLHINLKMGSLVKSFLFGGGFAILIYTISSLISLSAGWLDIISVKANYDLLVLSFVFFLFISLSEEVMFRGVIQQILMDIPMNKMVSLCITAFLFMALHLGNPGISWLPLLNIFLAGVLLGVSMLYSCNLWFPISFHLFWNWLQGPILGYKVSGMTLFTPLIKTKQLGSSWVTGGSFGFEGTLICTVLLVIAIVILFLVFEKVSKSTTDLHQS